MKVVELLVYLCKLANEGKGEYIVYDEGYMNEILEDNNIFVDDEKQRVYL